VNSSFSGDELRRCCEQPVSDGRPVVRLRVVDREVVGTGRQDKEAGAAPGAGDEAVGHLHAEEAVAVALNDEDG